MSRTSSSSKKVSVPTSYRLKSPARPTSPTAVVMRGHRLLLGRGMRARITRMPPSPNPPNPTESEMTPLPRKQGLQRTYSFLVPADATALATFAPAAAVSQLRTLPVNAGVADTNVSPSPYTPASPDVFYVGTSPANVGAPDVDISPNPHTPTSTAADSNHGKRLNSSGLTLY